MSKIRIFVAPEIISDNFTVNDWQLAHKLKDVLRLSPGDDIFVFDGCGHEYLCQLSEFNKQSFSLVKKKLHLSKPRNYPQVSLAFPLTQEEKIDFILQKATELGVDRFIPYICQRSLIQKPPSNNKLKRWQRIIVDALRQAQGFWLPQLEETVDFKQLLTIKADKKIAAIIDGMPLAKKELTKAKDILIVVGPKGDFSPEEINLFKKHDFYALKLSENILRTETAAIFAVGLLKLRGSDLKLQVGLKKLKGS